MFTYLINHSPIFYFIQSLWRDEAFSILTAERPLSFFLPKLTFEPPVYYTLLHFWIKLFGNSEIATRSLSFLAFAVSCFIVIEWADKLFKKSWLSVLLPLIYFANPMLVYYAFEVRTYGVYMFFATLSLYAYSQKRWKLFAVATILGFYTHTYYMFLFAAQILHYLLVNAKKLMTKHAWTKTVSDPAIKSISFSILCIAPWIVRVILESAKLKNSWYFPVNINLVKSVLGNMFLGYEGTPWYMWNYTAILSIVLLGFCIVSFINKKTRQRNGLFLLSIFIPLAIVIGVSFIKPLFVNRYLIYVTIAEVFTIVFALEAVKNKYIQIALGITILLGEVWFNTWYPLQHPKTPIRDTIVLINNLRGKDDVIYATSPLILFESIYYSNNRNNVFLYNPSRSPFPWYVGDAIFSESLMEADLPMYPKRAFLVNADGTFQMSYRLPKPVTVLPASKTQ